MRFWMVLVAVLGLGCAFDSHSLPGLGEPDDPAAGDAAAPPGDPDAEAPPTPPGDPDASIMTPPWVADASPDDERMPFGAECHDDWDCDSNMCRRFKGGKSLCTQPCWGDDDCPDGAKRCDDSKGYCEPE